jgi:predicted AlkP superfamily pyrophosphatase or phosphodiesterase
VDHVAHIAGPDAPAVDSAVVAMDALVARLLDGIQGLPIAARVNLVLVSDHGMAPVPPRNVVFLDDVVDLHDIRVINNRTQALLYFDGDEARMWEVFEALNERLEHATAYLKSETPERWHYRESRRIGDLVVAAEPGWVLGTREDREWAGGGMHGWDPSFRPMHGIFLAAGPGVRPGTRPGDRRHDRRPG